MMIELFRRIFFLLLYRINKLINNFYSRINGKMTLTQSLNVTTRFSRRLFTRTAHPVAHRVAIIDICLILAAQILASSNRRFYQ